MATVAQVLFRDDAPLAWLKPFLQEEMAPYPGRGALVARMAVAATVAMVISLTFRIPYGDLAAIYTFIISRESLQATVRDAKTIVLAFAFSVVYVLIGALIFLANPMTRLIWVVGTFFVMFYALSVLTNYTAAARFGTLLAITIPLWDGGTTAELRVAGTLWAFASVALGSVVTILTELVFEEFSPREDLIQSVVGRLTTVRDLLHSYAEARPIDGNTEKQITHLAVVGSSRLRRILQRSNYPRRQKEQLGAVVALVGRLVEIAANLQDLNIVLSPEDCERMRMLFANVGDIRAALQDGRGPNPIDRVGFSPRVPLLHELDTTVSLISTVFVASQPFAEYAPGPEGVAVPFRLFVPDALSNMEHIEFGLKGCLAASLCYLIYNGANWHGISTAVTTCFVTGLSTVGSSHQKQVLRISGAIVGGVIAGIGAQVFILPCIDSVGGFTLLFLAVTIPAAWIATSGPRLSYFGLQIAVAFYLINLSAFKAQTSLDLARDRVVGILLGLFMMWLVFDRLWGAPAAVSMRKTFSFMLRLLAQFAREPVSTNRGIAIDRSYAVRESITASFDKVRALADGVLFEFGPSRRENLEFRDKIRRLQPQLRIHFLARIVLWKYRAELPGFELSAAIRAAQQQFDEETATVLDGIANRIEGKESNGGISVHDSFECLEKSIGASRAEVSDPAVAARLQTILALNRRVDELTTALERQV